VTVAGDVHPVTARAWSELLHAEVGARLGAADIPCLHIKGPTVATWLYQPGERSWGDVDILLPPSRMDDALEVLLAAAFTYRDAGLRWRTSEDHALTLNFDPRGDAQRKVAAEVDVHHRFLGIDGDPETVFATLWERRVPVRLAELEVWFPDLTTRSLIAVLNSARDPRGEKAPRDLVRLLAAATDEDWAATIALAEQVDALQSLRAGLETNDAGRELVARTRLADVTVSAAVRLRAEGSTRTAVRLQELRTFGTWKKLRMVAGWVVPSPAIIKMREPAAAGSPWRMARAYLNRYRQGARELAGTIREMRSPRRPTSPTAPEPTRVAEPRPDVEEAGSWGEDDLTATRPAVTSGYRRPSYVGAVRDHSQVILLDLRDGERRVLNPAAATIWETLMATGSVSATVTELEAAFPDASGLADDVAAFVTGLEEQGLVEQA
jgi:hypothetical protein